MDLSQSFTCSVCDDELTSVSTLHYHQMCLHTAEELSLAILALRELPVNASPAENEGVSNGAIPSPSTDCEDNLLRNGLAKYPRFLNANGCRKSKVLNSDTKRRNAEDTAGTPKNQVSDKENIVQNIVDKNSVISGNEIGAVETSNLQIEILGEEVEGTESVKSRLWGAIKTLDGKTVDAPIVRIDKRKNTLKSNKSQLCNAEKNIVSESSKTVSENCNESESIAPSRKANVTVGTGDGHTIDKSSPNKIILEAPDEEKMGEQESDSGKEKILEKHLKLMNMSSFDDVIELEYSDESDDDNGGFLGNKSHSEENEVESEELETDDVNGVLTSKDCSLSLGDKKSLQTSQVPDRIKNIRNRRFWGKIQKHRSWYRGNHLNSSPLFKKKLKCGNSDLGKACDINRFGSGATKIANPDAISDEISGGVLDHEKVLIDSAVQTDETRKVSESGEAILRKELVSRRDTPRNKCTNASKFMKDNSLKQRSVCRRSKGPIPEDITIIPAEIEFVRIKPEVVYVDGERRYSCEECSKTYKKRSHLERHRRVHTGERPFVCQYCEKGFSVRSILNQHIRIHTGEKPYSCTICSSRFPQKSGLMTHMMLHTGKPFKCDQCDKAFVSNHKLINHLKSHEGDRPHVCTECNSAFFTNAALNDHQQMHSRRRKHICNKCNASFVHEVYLKIHLATHLLEADRESLIATGDTDSSDLSATTQTNGSPEANRELTLTLDAIDKFCNGEAIMMDMSV